MVRLSPRRLFENLMIARKYELSSRGRSVIEYILILIGLGSLFYFLFGVTFRAQFALIDDHQILNYISPRTSLWDLIVSDMRGAGRFRPVYWIIYSAQIATFGANSQIWHIFVTSLGVLTCFLLYIAVRKIGSDIPSSLLFVLLLAISGFQNIIWYHLGTNETQGMLLAAVSLLAIVNAAYQRRSWAWDGLALTAMALAGLTKESFVLVIPALLLLRWTLHCWFNQSPWLHTLRTLRAPLIIGFSIFVVETLIMAAILFLKPSGYGAITVGLSANSFDPASWYTLLTSSELATLANYLPLFIALILAVYWPEKQLRPYILAGSLVCAAWVIPQLVLYNSQGIGRHYLFPGVVGIAAVILCGLVVLWRRRVWLLWAACILWFLPILSSGIDMTIQAAGTDTASTLAVHEMVTYLSANTAPSQSIVIMADPAANYESIYSLRAHLRFAGSKSPIYLFPLLPKQGYTSERSQRQAKGITAMFPDLGTLDPGHIGGVIVLTTPADFSDIPWLVASPWQGRTFAEPYSRYDLSLQKLGYEQAGYVSYNILTPGEALSSFPPDYPLVAIDPALRGKVGIGLVRTAWWGMENTGRDSLLWLGHGEEEGLGGMLWATERQAVQAILEVALGPARPDSQRTIELTVRNQAGIQTVRRQFNQATELTFPGELQPGFNEFRITVLDKATIFKQSNGDTRPLLVLLRHITVRPLSTK